MLEGEKAEGVAELGVVVVEGLWLGGRDGKGTRRPVLCGGVCVGGEEVSRVGMLVRALWMS